MRRKNTPKKILVVNFTITLTQKEWNAIEYTGDVLDSLYDTYQGFYYSVCNDSKSFTITDTNGGIGYLKESIKLRTDSLYDECVELIKEAMEEINYL